MARSGSVVSALAVSALACATASADAPPARPGAAKAAAAKAAKRKRFAAVQAHISTPSDAAETPAVRYGAMTQDECEDELRARDIDFVRETAVGVLAPVRVSGTLRGVTFRTDGKEADRQVSPYEIADCRLVLALDDFAGILASYNIVEVRHYSMYRPPHGWPEDKIGAQHNGGLALDAGRFIDRDGHTFDVLRDFHGHIGGKTCGDGAGPHPATPDAVTLRQLLCEAVDQHLFNVVLTPNYNRPHRNHFHLEVMAGARWFLVH